MITLTATVHPDVIEPAVRWLTQITELDGWFHGRIGTLLPAEDVWPAARLDVTGGFSLFEARLDQTLIQVHSFAVTEQDAMHGARLLRAALVQMEGYREAGVICFTNVDTSSPQLLPDDSRTPPISHATFAATVTFRPDP